MYNRYIPQPDGSYKRRMMEDQVQSPPPGKRRPPTSGGQEETTTNQPVACAPIKTRPSQPDRPRCRDCPKQKAPRSTSEKSAGSFLRDLLPKDLDTGDLLVIVLLLLMSADGQEDQGNALLTLALYLFM